MRDDAHGSGFIGRLPLGGDELASIGLEVKRSFELGFEDIERVRAMLEGQTPVPCMPNLGFGHTNRELLPELTHRRGARRLTGLHITAWQREGRPIARPDDQDLPLEPKRHERAASLRSTDEPIRAKRDMRRAIHETRRCVDELTQAGLDPSSANCGESLAKTQAPMHRVPAMSAQLDRCLIAIAETLPSDAVRTDPDLRAAYAHDESEARGTTPDAIVRTRDAREVSSVLRAASQFGVAVTPRGGGTGRTGGAVPMRGGIVLTSERMNELIEIDRGDRIAVVGSGLITAELHRVLELERLFWGPDPNSAEQCTLGGNIAENAGGPRSFKHGVTRDWVLGLEVVTGDGTILELGRRTKKGVTGYDLTSLVVGSEGTLAVVTRATLRVTTAPEKVITVLAFLPTEAAIAPAIAAALDARVTPRCIELLDDATLNVLRGTSAVPMPEGAHALLVIELEGDESGLDRDLTRLGDALSEISSFDPLVATAAGERERFWRVRKDMSRALRRTARWKTSEDVVVPRSRIAELLGFCRVIAERHAIRMPVYGHAGDGNLHVNLLWDEEAQKANVELAIAELFEATVSLGGTLSGEHGMGSVKAPYLSIEQSPELIALQRRVKDTFDPRGILNPGKIFPQVGHRGC